MATMKAQNIYVDGYCIGSFLVESRSDGTGRLAVLNLRFDKETGRFRGLTVIRGKRSVVWFDPTESERLMQILTPEQHRKVWEVLHQLKQSRRQYLEERRDLLQELHALGCEVEESGSTAFPDMGVVHREIPGEFLAFV